MKQVQDLNGKGVHQYGWRITETVSQLALFADYDPVNYESAVKEEKWQIAMEEEIWAIEKNNTWELVDLPDGEKAICVKWVYKTKRKPNGEVDKHKARLVVKGYIQEPGIDYTEVFALVVRLDTVRTALAVAAKNDWPVYQLDVKSAFLHGELNERVFVEQPLGFIEAGQEHKVYKLKKALYGLKQAPRAWYCRIDTYFLKEGFIRCPYEHTLYVKQVDGKILIVCLYVDDLLYTSDDIDLLKQFKLSMKLEFDMTDLGMLHHFLGLEVTQTGDGIFVC